MQPLCDLNIVNVINSSCTAMVTALLFNAFMVRSLHIMMSMPVLTLTGKTHTTVRSNEETLCMTNTYMKKKF